MVVVRTARIVIAIALAGIFVCRLFVVIFINKSRDDKAVLAGRG
jgi:hypothetical protein